MRSSDEGEGVDEGRLSSGERAGLGRPSREDGDVDERGVDGPLVPRPFMSFSLDRWAAGGARDGGLREEGEGEEEEVRRMCDAESARLRHGIFSRLTTGRDTLERGGAWLKHCITKCFASGKSSRKHFMKLQQLLHQMLWGCE